jgi:hypothetical protein
MTHGQGESAATFAPPLGGLWSCCLFLRPNSFIRFFIMQFKVGDIVHNKITQEEGRILRIADIPGYGLGYIVAIAPNPARGTTANEAIWKRSEVIG